MIRASQYPFLLLIIVIGVTATSRAADGPLRERSATERMRVLNNIAGQKSWLWNGGPIMSVADQQVFVGGQLRVFADVPNDRPIDEGNAHAVTSAMYAALGCRCGETIADVMRLLSRWLDDDESNVYGTGPHLEELNRIVVKTVAALFEFADAAPNVWSLEPGILRAAVSLNLHVNNLLEYHRKNTLRNRDGVEVASASTRRVIFQMMNLIERHTIPKCSSPVLERPDPMRYSMFRSGAKQLTPRFEREMRHLIKYYDDLLNGTGLSTVDFYEYNINVNRSGKTSLNDENSRFDIVSHVENEFGSVLDCLQCFAPKIAHTDVESVLLFQSYAFDVISFVIDHNTEVYLRQFKLVRYYGDEAVAEIDSKKKYIKENDLIDRYQRLIVQLNLVKFPLAVVSQVSQILRILKSVLMFGSVGRGLNVLYENKNDGIHFLMEKYRYRKEITSSVINVSTLAKKNELELHSMLEKIANVKGVKRYNNIFKILQNGLEEPNEKAKLNLNAIEYHYNTKNYVHNFCHSILSVYALCFDIQTSVNGSPPKTSLKYLENRFLSVLYILKAIVSTEENNLFADIIIYADQYISYNLVKYPEDGNVQEKLNRILYLVTNLIDKFQVCSCEKTRYRDMLYSCFKTDPKFLETLLDLNKNVLKEFITGKKKSEFDKETTKNNLDTYVLFKQFIRDMDNNNNATQPIKLFWKGELKTIDEISQHVEKNLFDFLSIPDYVSAVVNWTTVIFAYTFLDIMNYLLTESDKETDLHKTVELFKNKLSTQTWPKSSTVAFNTIIRGMRTLILPFFSPKIFEMKTILENDLKQYNRVVLPKTKTLGKRPLNFKKLNQMCEVFNKILTHEIKKSCETRGVINPLVYTISYYFSGWSNLIVR